MENTFFRPLIMKCVLSIKESNFSEKGTQFSIAYGHWSGPRELTCPPPTPPTASLTINNPFFLQLPLGKLPKKRILYGQVERKGRGGQPPRP